MRADCPGVGWGGGRTVATDVAGARRSMFHTPLVSPSRAAEDNCGGGGGRDSTHSSAEYSLPIPSFFSIHPTVQENYIVSSMLLTI